MTYEVISFDLQGTLSDPAFSDEVWKVLLPQMYAEQNGLSTIEASETLCYQFQRMGRYDRRYYSFDDWLKPSDQIPKHFKRARASPSLFPEMKSLILKLKSNYPLLLFSATSRSFIQYELGELSHAFTWVISALDDLNCAGKPPSAYVQLAKMLSISPHRILHIGDDPLMDVENAQAAGWNAFHFNRAHFEQLCALLAIS